MWDGGFNFAGTNSLNMGSGAVTLGANAKVILAKNVLSVNSIGGPYTLTVASTSNTFGNTIGGALEVPTFGSITTSGLSIGAGGTLAFPAATNTPGQLAGYASSLQGDFASNVYSSANIGIDTAGVPGGRTTCRRP